MKILIACEESQTVTKEFRKLGHEAYSCDLQPCSGGHPEWHMQEDVIPLLNMNWDMIIAHPPCTHLASSGARYLKKKLKEGKVMDAVAFFMLFARAKAPRVAIENPIGIMSNMYRKPNQIIQPYEYGDSFTKATCLWLKRLPNLIPTKIVDKGEQIEYGPHKKRMSKWMFDSWGLPTEEKTKLRSKTFPGIAQAMADQWGKEELVSCSSLTQQLIWI